MTSFPPSRIRNVALVGHNGAGKTTLAEALLFATGAIARAGRVDDGSTVCDFEPEEIKRNMSISLALAPVVHGDVKINIIDTPGYADFFGEVRAAMSVVDLVVVVVSAVDGVEAQTEAVWDLAADMGLPRLVFVNKLDRERASFDRTLADLQESFGAGIAPLELPVGEESSFHGIADLLTDSAILYEGGHWLFRGADGLRTADDLGRFRLQYALGVPCFGVHGSFLIVRGLDEPGLSFDVGKRGSLTEDAAWALRAWAGGRRFRWVRGHLHEQPPQSVGDFRRQRGRWISGLRRVCADRELPLRNRAVLCAAVALWQLSFLPLLVAVLSVVVRQGPDAWLRGPADFGLTTFVLAYAQGAAVRVAHPFRTGDAHRSAGGRLVRPVRVAAATLLFVPFIWYVTMEALGVLRAMSPTRRFHVIAKPAPAPLRPSLGGAR